MDQLSNVTNGQHLGDAISNEEFEEVRIGVPWGHIAGKWWGPRINKPILAIHGWQDNAGSFDKLSPVIANFSQSILCIDLPGHGYSSPYPSGMYYFAVWDGLQIVKRIMHYYKWKTVKLIGHSLGGIISFLYASAFPDEVEFFISLDIASPAVREPANLVQKIGSIVTLFLKYDNCLKVAQPCYDYEEMVATALAGYHGSCTRESIEILLKRGMKQVGDDKYVFTRDIRLKAIGLAMISIEEALAMAKQIKCPVLNLRAKQGIKLEHPEYYDMVLDALEGSCSDMERHIVDGHHHFHLNDVQSIAEIVTNFLARYNDII